MKEGTGQFCPSFIITERGRGQFCRSFVSSSSLLCQVLEIKIQSQSDLRLHLLSQISPRYHHRQLNRHHFYRHHFYGAGWVLFVTSPGLFMSHSFTAVHHNRWSPKCHRGFDHGHHFYPHGFYHLHKFHQIFITGPNCFKNSWQLSNDEGSKMKKLQSLHVYRGKCEICSWTKRKKLLLQLSTFWSKLKVELRSIYTKVHPEQSTVDISTHCTLSGVYKPRHESTSPRFPIETIRHPVTSDQGHTLYTWAQLEMFSTDGFFEIACWDHLMFADITPEQEYLLDSFRLLSGIIWALIWERQERQKTQCSPSWWSCYHPWYLSFFLH